MEKVVLEKYAQLAVKMGANVQPGQPVIVRTSPEALPLTREIVKAAYEAGASQVRVDINDSVIGKAHYVYQSIETIIFDQQRRVLLLLTGICLKDDHRQRAGDAFGGG